jgi:hypothetical protein
MSALSESEFQPPTHMDFLLIAGRMTNENYIKMMVYVSNFSALHSHYINPYVRTTAKVIV